MSNQTTCQNCNAVLAEGTMFCTMCGTKIEAPASETVSEAKKKPFNLSEMFKKPLFIAIPAAILVLIILIAVVIKLKPSGGSHLIYVKDKELQFSNLSKKTTFELTDRLFESSGYMDADDYMLLSAYIFMSDDERYIFYPDRCDDYNITYYWRDLKADNIKKDTSVKIDSEINTYPHLSKDGSKFFYIKGDDNRLYVYDRKSDEKVKLDDGVEHFYVNDSGDYIIYSRYIDQEYTIYEMSMKGTSGEKTKIDSNSIIQEAYPNEKKIYYTKDDSLYLKEFGKNKEKITSDFESLVSVVDKSSVYYLKKEEVVNKLSNYIKDDMIDEDKEEILLPEPNYSEEPRYPSEYDYQTEVWVDSYWGYSRHPETNEWGYWDTVTDEEAYRAAIEEYNIKYSEWEKEVEQYNNEYNEAYQRILAKEYRDTLRELFDNEDNAITYDVYSLYYWNNGTETLVAEDISPYLLSISYDVSTVIYNKHNISSVDVQKLSEMTADEDNYYSAYDYAYDLQEKIRASRNLSDDIYIAIGDKETTIDCINAKNWSINSDGVIFFIDDYNDERGYGDLMSAAIKNDSIEKPVKIDEDVVEYSFGNENDNIFYFKDVRNRSGDVYMNDKLFATDVYIPSLYNYKGKNKLIYYIDYSDSSQSGTLCIFDNGTETRISDDVSFFVPINENHIAYLIDYRFEREKGDLMLYNGKKKPVPIDTDVTALLWRPDMLWGVYWYYYY